MLIDLLKDVLLELIRALFVEELCQRVKKLLQACAQRQRIRRREELLKWLHLRHRQKLLHKLTTEAQDKL